MTLTKEQLQKACMNWSLVVKTIPGYGTMPFVPKGDPTSLTTLLANWSQADPGYTKPTEAQIVAAIEVIDNQIAMQGTAESIETDAIAGWNSIPDWATWTAEEAELYIENNVTNLASAKIIMKKQAIAIMWLADKVFPNRR
jgi:hypothetical protein